MASGTTAGRRQFRSLSVASSDPLSPYFTHYKGRQLSKSPSVVGIPHFDADGYARHTSSRKGKDSNPDGERRQNSKSSDIPGLNLTLSPNDPKATTIRQHYYPEGGWGWIVLLCAIIVHILASALHISVGFFILDIRQQFLKGQGSIEAVILGALSTSVSLFLSPVVVALCRRKSIRLMSILGCLVTALGCLFSSFATQLHQLYLSYGLFVGCGDCLARETSTIMVGQYFKKRRETVEMIILMGKGLGFATMPLLVKHWIRSLGWRRGLQLVAGVQCLSCVLGLFFRPASLYHPQRRAILHIKSLQKRSKAKDKMPPAQEKHAFFDFSVLKSRTVQVINVATAITAFGVTSPIILLMHEAQDEGISNSSMTQLQIILGVAVTVGTAAFGLVVIKNSIQCLIAKQYLCQAASLLISGWLLTFPTLHGFHGYVLFVCVYGVFYGGYFYSLKLCVFEKVRARNFARAWGFVEWCQAVPGFIGIPVTGYLNQVCSGRSGFYFSSATVFVGSMFLFFIDVHKNQLRKKKKMEDLKQRFSESQLPSADHSRRPSQETVFGQMLPKSYLDIRKAQELTCISEEVLVDNFLEDYVDDGITSCNKEEKFLMLSEFENNLFKTDGTERDREFTGCRDESGITDSCQHCPICFRAKDPRNSSEGVREQSVPQENKISEVIDEVTTSL